MPEAMITDPDGTNGLNPTFYQINVSIEAASAVAAGDLVALVFTEGASRDLDVLKCAKYATGTHGTQARCGVALNAIAAGQKGLVTIIGYAVVNIGSGNSVTAGKNLIASATAGIAADVTAVDATVAGSIKGVYLSDELGTSDQAAVWLY